MNKESNIYISGHNGLVGSAILRSLQNKGYKNIITRTRKELNLLNQNDVKDFFEKEKLEYVFLSAAKVGGIGANDTYPAEFIYENLQIQNNIIHNSYLSQVKKLLFLGSSCIYPKYCNQPIKEEYLLTGLLEETNEPYSIAKIAGIKMCENYNKQYGTNFIACMPTNLYGQKDNFDLKRSHVLPALIRKFHEAKVNCDDEVVLWGDGSAMREFLYVDDMAEACIYMMNELNIQNNKGKCKIENNSGISFDGIFVNIGIGKDITIKELAKIIQEIVGFKGNIVWDTSKPNGTPRKLLDISKIEKLGWKYKILLEEGIKKSYEFYLNKI